MWYGYPWPWWPQPPRLINGWCPPNRNYCAFTPKTGGTTDPHCTCGQGTSSPLPSDDPCGSGPCSKPNLFLCPQMAYLDQ